MEKWKGEHTEDHGAEGGEVDEDDDNGMDVDPQGSPAGPKGVAQEAVDASEGIEDVQLEEDEDSDDEDQEDPADVAMVPMADMLNARFESENVGCSDVLSRDTV